MKSMTGFGSAVYNLKNARYTVELTSTNHKYLDVYIPDFLSSLHEGIRELIKKKIQRGHINVFVMISDSSGKKDVVLDEVLARRYLISIKKLQTKLALKGRINFETLLNFPDIIKVIDKRKNYWRGLKIAITKALDELVKSKQREGNKIYSDIRNRIGKLKDMLDNIVEINERAVPENKRRIEERLKNIFKDVKMDESRICAEVSFIVEKNDITEELIRLKSHFNEFYCILNQKIIGRKLDFLIQEFMREINTIGSKANNFKISHIVVSFKEELEKIREQVQNVE